MIQNIDNYFFANEVDFTATGSKHVRSLAIIVLRVLKITNDTTAK